MSGLGTRLALNIDLPGGVTRVGVLKIDRAMSEKKDCWLPLEANPDVMNKYASNLGMEMDYQFHDVFGLDSELLAMVPQPCIALLLLFPINEKFVKYEEEEKQRIQKEGQLVNPDVFFIKQTIGNACGTVGLLHALGNCTSTLKFGNGFLKTFFDKTKNMSPEERGKYLEEDEGISEAHEASAQEGDTAPPPPEEKVNLHFIALVCKDGHLYELDGRKPFPINHGPTTPERFLQDGARVCQEFMARDPSEMHFTVVALAATS